mmetsp:Transcript_39472/g.85951  ORF Transcript_39472/g.85951 Transcript_39472/m.85951 type:complete len:227 (+) Transcript_39472:86-766(+)
MHCRSSLAVILLAGVACAPLLAPAFTGLTTAPRGATATSLRASGANFDVSSTPSQPELAEEVESPSPLRLGGACLSILAALVVTFAPISEAQAAKSGGRIGGSAPSRKPAPPPPRTVNKTTIINKTTVVAPPPVVAAPPVIAASPVMGGFGYGPAVVVAPPPTLGDVIVGAAVGSAINNAIGGGQRYGPSGTDRMLENQQRQDERQMDRQAAQIDELQRELRDMKK